VLIQYDAALSHHHGVCLLRAPYMRDSLGSAFPVLQAVKRMLDPKNILNSGKLGPTDEQAQDAKRCWPTCRQYRFDERCGNGSGTRLGDGVCARQPPRSIRSVARRVVRVEGERLMAHFEYPHAVFDVDEIDRRAEEGITLTVSRIDEQRTDFLHQGFKHNLLRSVVLMRGGTGSSLCATVPTAGASGFGLKRRPSMNCIVRAKNEPEMSAGQRHENIVRGAWDHHLIGQYTPELPLGTQLNVAA
jgi:hypothetical protein